MKHNKKTKLLGFGALLLGGVLLSSCTANFCNAQDKAHMAYPYEQGVTIYVDKEGYEAVKADENLSKLIAEEEERGIAGPAFVDDEGNAINDNVYKYVPYELGAEGQITFTASKAKGLLQPSVIDSAFSSGYAIPSVEYWASIDDFVLNAATFLSEQAEKQGNLAYSPTKDGQNRASDEYVANLTVDDINPYAEPDEFGDDGKLSEANADSILRNYGYVKFTGESGEFMGYYNQWANILYGSDEPGLGMDNCPTQDFLTAYENAVLNKVNSNRSCIATQDGLFGHYGAHNDWEVNISKKSWGYAWGLGFLEGLLVYPVSWLVDTFAYSFDPLLVRGLLLLVTFPTTMDTQKMQALQPELAKLQAKYPNSNTNQAEKARMAQEQMALYKRHKIHPFRQILVLIIQFPVFICVWSGLQGSAALSSGSVLNLNLSDTISSILFDVSAPHWYYNTTGWWTALILFILMAAIQIMSMLLPRIIQKIQLKKQPKLGKNPAANSQQKQMKWVSIFIMGFTILMGFFLPSAMAVYWLIGGLISIAQTGITQLIMAKAKKKRTK